MNVFRGEGDISSIAHASGTNGKTSTRHGIGKKLLACPHDIVEIRPWNFLHRGERLDAEDSAERSERLAFLVRSEFDEEAVVCPRRRMIDARAFKGVLDIGREALQKAPPGRRRFCGDVPAEAKQDHAPVRSRARGHFSFAIGYAERGIVHLPCSPIQSRRNVNRGARVSTGSMH